MKPIRLSVFERAVGSSWVESKKRNPPKNDWSRKTVGNVIYIFVKTSTKLTQFCFYMNKLENTSGKSVEFCPVPKSIIKGI